MPVTACIAKDKDYTVKIRSGTLSLAELQKVLLEIMDEIHRVCVKNNIRYGLIAGSALGIVNYGGFIPWDDDIDVAVLREDWPRFLEALRRDLAEDYYFQCFETDTRYNTFINPSMKIRKRGTYIREKHPLVRNRCKSGDGVFVDVVVYDNVNENNFIDQRARWVTRLLLPLAVLLDNLGINPVRIKAFNLRHAYAYSRRCENSRLISQPVSVPFERIGREPVFDKTDVLPFRPYPFEGRTYYSYNHIEPIMRKWYGENCLKRQTANGYEDPLPEKRRTAKHIRDVNLHGEQPLPKKRRR